MLVPKKYMLEVTCRWCKKRFWTRKAGKTTRKCCSVRCAAQERGSRPEVRQKISRALRKERVTRKCQWCGGPFVTEQRSKKRFCGRSCSAKWRMKQPEIIAIMKSPKRGMNITKALLNWRKTERGQQVAAEASERMKKKNPMNMVGVVEKMLKTKENNGTLHVWKGKRGGNGQYTPEQLRLRKVLGSKWTLELPIRTHQKPPYPTAYKVDIGRKKYKIAIEVDGPCHRHKKNIEKDKRKDTLLASLGWKVFRFTNAEVMNDLYNVLKTIHSFTT